MPGKHLTSSSGEKYKTFHWKPAIKLTILSEKNNPFPVRNVWMVISSRLTGRNDEVFPCSHISKSMSEALTAGSHEITICAIYGQIIFAGLSSKPPGAEINVRPQWKNFREQSDTDRQD